MVKSLEKQIEFIDKKLLVLFGINSITDYKTVVYLDNITKTLDIEILNNLMDDIKTTFQVKEFNFHKTDNKINSHNHAFNVLKKCLEMAMIPHDVGYNKKKKYLRLISFNNILHKYIEMNQIETSEIRTLKSNFCVTSNVEKIEPTVNITYKDFIDNIKKEYTYDIYLNPVVLWNTKENLFEINLMDYNLHNKNIKDLKLDIISEKMGINDIVSKNIIHELLSKTRYEISSGVRGSQLLISQQFKCNKNLLPDNCVIPLQSIYYSLFSLVIKNAGEIHKILNVLQFKITVTCVDFYNEFTKKIHTSQIEQSVQNEEGLCNLFRVLNGMWGMAYFEYTLNANTVSSDVNLKKNEDEQNETLKTIVGNDVTIEKIKGYHIVSEIDMHHKLCKPLLALSVKKCTFVSYEQIYECPMYYCVVINNKFKHTYEFKLGGYADSIGKFNIIFANDFVLDDKNINMYCSDKNNLTNNLTNIDFEIEHDKNCNKTMLSLKKNYHINLLKVHNVIIEITSKSLGDTINIVNSIYSPYFWQTNERKKMLHTCDNYFHINSLYEM